jgi:hypothetical protein
MSLCLDYDSCKFTVGLCDPMMSVWFKFTSAKIKHNICYSLTCKIWEQFTIQKSLIQTAKCLGLFRNFKISGHL